MIKNFINQREGKIAVTVDLPKMAKNPRGLVFIAHGLGGTTNQPHIQAYAQFLSENGFTTVRWDARSSVGASQGKMENATLSNYLDDFKTVSSWATGESWYQEPFLVCGHSLGAACSLLLTLENQHKVMGLILTSAFVSGHDFERSLDKQELVNWRATDYREWQSSSLPGITKRLKWDFMEDAYAYNLLDDAHKIKQPALIIVGSEDKVTPPSLQKRLLKKLASKQKELRVISGAEHTFTDSDHLNQIDQIISEWLGENFSN
jgi:uncharacterized protein